MEPMANHTTYWPPKKPTRGIGHWVTLALTIEPAVDSDVDEFVRIVATAPERIDPRLTTLFPRREKYPDDFRRFIAEHIRESMLNPLHRVMAAVVHINSHDPRCGCAVNTNGVRIVGFAIWERMGVSAPDAVKEKETTWLWMSRMLRSAVATLTAPVDFNSAVDYDGYHHWMLAKDHEDGEYQKWHKDYWRLHAVVVDEMWRSFGVGSKLISWGLQKARDENITAVAETSPVGEHCEEVFVRLGFTRFGMFLPTYHRIEMGCAMRWKPWEFPRAENARPKADAGKGVEEGGKIQDALPTPRTKAGVCTCYG
jgi:GNAT superfamily N-acetyltransferase